VRLCIIDKWIFNLAFYLLRFLIYSSFFLCFHPTTIYIEFDTNQGIIFAISAAAFIIIPFLVFLVYDQKSLHRQEVILTSANQNNAIVSALFPKNVREKIMSVDANGNTMLHLLSSNTIMDTPPIADLFPETSVLFCDIADFTAWVS
jgi:hypothetical protein